MGADRHTRRFLPQIGHWTSTICVNQDGSIFAIYHLSGFAADLAGVRAILSAHMRDNYLATSIAHPRIEWWDHFVRQDRQQMADLPPVPNWFGARFDAAYRATQGDGALFRNDLFVTIVMHPEDTLRSGLRALLGGGRTDHPHVDDVMIQDFEAVLHKLDAGLARYGVRRLGMRTGDNGVVFSEVAEALHLVVHGRFRPLGLTAGRMGNLIVPERLVFGHRDIQIMGEGEPLFVAVLTFMDYAGAHADRACSRCCARRPSPSWSPARSGFCRSQMRWARSACA